MSTPDSPRVQYSITDGGNKFELFAQLADIGRFWNNERPPFWLQVRPYNLRGTMAPKANIMVWVDGIRAVDGSGESWAAECYLPGSGTNAGTATKYPWLSEMFTYTRLTAHYSTRDRKGYITLDRR